MATRAGPRRSARDTAGASSGARPQRARRVGAAEQIDGPSSPEALARTAQIAHAVALILAHYDDPEREGLRETPARVARMYAELLTPQPFAFTTFDAEGADQMIVQRGIRFYTLCEHHLIPFFGTATVAYIPQGRIVGLSKLARTVEYFARALTNQERLTNQIADFLVEHLDPLGVGVTLEAAHLCMAMRGVRQLETTTTTSALRGAIREKPEARAEFLALAGATQRSEGRA